MSERSSAEEPGFLTIFRPSPAAAGLCAYVVVEATAWFSGLPASATMTAKFGIVATVLIKECVRRGR